MGAVQVAHYHSSEMMSAGESTHHGASFLQYPEYVGKAIWTTVGNVEYSRAYDVVEILFFVWKLFLQIDVACIFLHFRLLYHLRSDVTTV